MGMESEIGRLHAAARAQARSRAKLIAAVRGARAAGLTVRAIATAASISTQTVQRWTKGDDDDD